jgi:hypothetical protein
MLFVGLAIGAIPNIDEWMFDSTAPLRFLTDFLLVVGYVGIYLPLIMLGVNLYDFRHIEPPFSTQYLASIIICKLIVVSGIVLVYFVVLDSYTDIGDNIPLAYTAYLAAIAPSAQLLLAF